MKKNILISIVALLLLATQSFGQGIKFENIKFDEALILAQKSKNKRQIFVDFFTTWCGPCRMMSEKIFPLKEVGTYMNANYVNLKIDAEKGEGVALAKRYNVDSYPTMLVLDADGKEVRRIIGSMSDYKEFIGRVAGNVSDETMMQEAKANYEKEATATNAISYLDALQKLNRHEELVEVISALYFSEPLQKRFNSNVWRYVDRYIHDPESKIIKDIVANKLYISSLQEIGGNSVNRKLKGVYGIQLLFALSGKVNLTKGQIEYYRSIVNLLERPNSIIQFPRPAIIVVAELAKLKADNNIDAMLDILETEVCMLPSSFYRYQSEVAFSEYKNLNPAQRARLKAYFEKVSKMEMELGEETGKLIEESHI